MGKNKVQFDNTFFNLGTIKRGQDAEIIATCDLGEEYLHYTYPLDGCNCLTGVIEGNKVRILFRPHKRYQELSEGEIKNYTGYLVVKLDKKFCEYVKNEDGQRIKNPNFRALRIHIVAQIVE